MLTLGGNTNGQGFNRLAGNNSATELLAPLHNDETYEKELAVFGSDLLKNFGLVLM